MYIIVYKVYMLFYKHYLYPTRTLLKPYYNTIGSILMASNC